MQEAERGATSQSIVAAVRDLLYRKQVPHRQHGKKLSEILKLSYSQAHRKLNTETGWTIAQLQTVANFFGESLSTLGLGEVSAVSDGHPIGTLAAGLFVVATGQHEYACTLWIGEQLQSARRHGFVAYQEANMWRAVETVQCPVGVVRHKINKLEIVLKQPRAHEVAVVGQDRDSVDSLSDYLNENDYKATALYSGTSLERRMHEGDVFDAYIIDWMLSHSTAEGLIKHIRFSAGNATPIFVLTEATSSDPADQDELARIITSFDVQVRNKPVRLRTFLAELNKALDTCDSAK